ncbi:MULTISPECIES: MobQ family relaxase [unclassified Chromohalobacter]|uniref:MobQ family relaxase n=1 Tax=unclassified Chromohalobacter TaxID=2628571 RepID=UPI0024690BC1|nr:MULTISPECIES: MobQ family relaxase [unclassified Chromohalobacter]
MAIYSLSTKPMNRKGGRSAVAAAAYRSGGELADERTGVVHDYTRKRGVEHDEIVTRDGVPGPERESLWNQAEAAEKRKDARVAREYVVALPHELDADQRLALARELAGELSERYGVAVDLAVHAPDRDGDERNHHAHLLATTRAYGHDGLGDKAAIEWSDQKRREAGLDRGADEVKAIRQRWEGMANDALERAQVAERIDCRSLADQGINRVPQIHVGPMGTEMERRGVPEQSDRASLNLEIQAANAAVEAERAEAKEPKMTRGEAFTAAAERMKARRLEREAGQAPRERPQRTQEPPKAPPGPSAAVQRLDREIDAKAQHLAQVRERGAEIGERLLDVQLAMRETAQQRDSTEQTEREAAQSVREAQAQRDRIKGWFKGRQRREASQRHDQAQERQNQAQEAAQRAQAHDAALRREYGQLKQQAATEGRDVERVKTEYAQLQQQRTAQIEREQQPAQEKRQGDAWSQERQQERSKAPQRDAWADERRQAQDVRRGNTRSQDGPELG